MHVDRNDLYCLNAEIWGAMLEIALEPAESGEPDSGHDLTGCVQITGAWEGAVRLDLTLRLARVAASRFLGVSEEEVSREQILDAVGELANMTAGSVKMLVPSPSHISLPSVTDGSDYHVLIPRGRLLGQASFAWRKERLIVSVLQKSPGSDVPRAFRGTPPAHA